MECFFIIFEERKRPLEDSETRVRLVKRFNTKVTERSLTSGAALRGRLPRKARCEQCEAAPIQLKPL
jgi:hypothetical protein